MTTDWAIVRRGLEAKPSTSLEIVELERRILATTDPVEKQRLLRELVALTKKETRG